MWWVCEWWWDLWAVTCSLVKIFSGAFLGLCLTVVGIQGMSSASQLWAVVQWLSCLAFTGFLALLAFLYLVVKNGSKEGSISIGYKNFFVKATRAPAPELNHVREVLPRPRRAAPPPPAGTVGCQRAGGPAAPRRNRV